MVTILGLVVLQFVGFECYDCIHSSCIYFGLVGSNTNITFKVL
jgi:hypothetical protein